MEQVCGDCRFFKTTREREDGRLGICRLEKVMGVFRESMRACPSFSTHGDPNPPVVYDAGRRRGVRRRVARVVDDEVTRPPTVTAADLAARLVHLDPPRLKAVIVTIIEQAQLLREPELGRHWVNGMFIMAPADDSLKVKELALEVYFHKLVMIRDNLRVLEQKVNSHVQLHDSERVDLQRGVTLCYDAVVYMGTEWVPEDSAAAELDHDTNDLMKRLLAEIRWESLSQRPPVLGARWAGGEARYTRNGETHVERIEEFFARLTVLRDRLLALEAIISAHPHIAPDEATSMGGYLRRCYGSLTTFNVLFRDREDYFASSK